MSIAVFEKIQMVEWEVIEVKKILRVGKSGTGKENLPSVEQVSDTKPFKSQILYVQNNKQTKTSKSIGGYQAQEMHQESFFSLPDGELLILSTEMLLDDLSWGAIVEKCLCISLPGKTTQHFKSMVVVLTSWG